jgi:hypothetical protein
LIRGGFVSTDTLSCLTATSPPSFNDLSRLDFLRIRKSTKRAIIQKVAAKDRPVGVTERKTKPVKTVSMKD